jgi:hypothetical protein
MTGARHTTRGRKPSEFVPGPKLARMIGRLTDTREFLPWVSDVDFDEAIRALNGHDLMTMRPAAVFFYRHFRDMLTQDDISTIVCMERSDEIIFWCLMLECEYGICVANLFPNYPKQWRVDES